jgi:prolyl oligopeptidase
MHGVTITDPYRWLEEQDSQRTREWLREQHEYARSYLDAIPERQRVRERIRDLLDVEAYESIQKVGPRYFFRKRLRRQEQFSIYFRDGIEGSDQLLIDPAARGTGPYTAVNPLQVSPDGRLILYEAKQGGERSATYEVFDVQARQILPDVLPRGHLRGFAFVPGSKSFYYVHEELNTSSHRCAAYHHVLGTNFDDDREIFCAGESPRVRLALFGEGSFVVFFVHRFEGDTRAEVYAKRFHSSCGPELLWAGATQILGLHFLNDRILALSDWGAPNRRIIEARDWHGGTPMWTDLISETEEKIESWWVVGSGVVVCYAKQTNCKVRVFDLLGRETEEIPLPSDETVRVISAPQNSSELLFQTQSLTKPAAILRYDLKSKCLTEFDRRSVPFESASYEPSQAWFTSKDGTTIPMHLVARRDVLQKGFNPTVMTAYGGYGASMMPRFSIFVAFLLERGCLFAMPSIRGGSEFGHSWHEAARRRNRQTAYDDFLSAAEWLISSEHTCPSRLAIFGGSNGGLLVAAALTQRPDLFRAAVCMSPVADMLRYHFFDDAHVWGDEFGIADDPLDFAALVKYSPYHRIVEGTAYPATLMVSGDADGNCNPLHARKMTARLQASNCSDRGIFLDYHSCRGHAAVLPLSDRIEALTDRVAFLCDQLQLSV